MIKPLGANQSNQGDGGYLTAGNVNATTIPGLSPGGMALSPGGMALAGPAVSGDDLFGSGSGSEASGLIPATMIVPQPVPSPSPPPTSSDLFASNLGIYYQMIPYSNGTFGARLTRYPLANSPAAQLKLEPGDTIFALDSQRFTVPDDIQSHNQQTTVEFVNVRTNGSQKIDVYIP
jgi:hypothetical protein